MNQKHCRSCPHLDFNEMSDEMYCKLRDFELIRLRWHKQRPDWCPLVKQKGEKMTEYIVEFDHDERGAVTCLSCGHRIAERPFEVYCNIMCKWVNEKDYCTMFEPGQGKMRKTEGQI